MPCDAWKLWRMCMIYAWKLWRMCMIYTRYTIKALGLRPEAELRFITNASSFRFASDSISTRSRRCDVGATIIRNSFITFHSCCALVQACNVICEINFATRPRISGGSREIAQPYDVSLILCTSPVSPRTGARRRDGPTPATARKRRRLPGGGRVFRAIPSLAGGCEKPKAACLPESALCDEREQKHALAS